MGGFILIKRCKSIFIWKYSNAVLRIFDFTKLPQKAIFELTIKCAIINNSFHSKLTIRRKFEKIKCMIAFLSNDIDKQTYMKT